MNTHSQGLHQAETLEDIKKYLQQSGVNLKDVSSTIEYEALRTLKAWVNQEGKEMAIDWDQFQDCVTFMFEDYCNRTREISQKLEECKEVCLFLCMVIVSGTNIIFFFFAAQKSIG